ncbi:hypothetical protein TELCIR_10105, partial [Teladorsagia circumcincta]
MYPVVVVVAAAFTSIRGMDTECAIVASSVLPIPVSDSTKACYLGGYSICKFRGVICPSYFRFPTVESPSPGNVLGGQGQYVPSAPGSEGCPGVPRIPSKPRLPGCPTVPARPLGPGTPAFPFSPRGPIAPREPGAPRLPGFPRDIRYLTPSLPGDPALP